MTTILSTFLNRYLTLKYLITRVLLKACNQFYKIFGIKINLINITINFYNILMNNSTIKHKINY